MKESEKKAEVFPVNLPGVDLLGRVQCLMDMLNRLTPHDRELAFRVLKLFYGEAK